MPPGRFLEISELEQSVTNGGFQILESESLPFDTKNDPRYVFARFIVAKKKV
jgi:hypothetical protein